MPETIEVPMELERSTKNTYRYAEIAEGKPPILKTLYIQKWALGTSPPIHITVTIKPT